MKSKSLRFIIVILMLFSFSLRGVAQDAAGPEPVGERPDAPPYGLHGPYWVGTRLLTAEPDSDRPLTIRMWYPALNAADAPESITYTIEHGPNFPAATIAGHALAEAEPNLVDGPYPLIVYSSGGGAMPEHNASLLEHLASYGFVVIGAGHPGATTVELMESFISEEGEATYLHNDALVAIYRPLDIQRQITFAETLTATDATFSGLIDAGEVAVMGTSYGGYTAMAAAGVPLNFVAFKTWCAENPADCALQEIAHFPQYEAEMTALVGDRATESGLWALGDPRIDALVALAPGSMPLFDDTGLQALEMPTLFIVGSLDEYGIDAFVEQAYDIINSPIRGEVILQNAGHMFANFTCADSPDYVAFGFFSFCSDPIWDMNRLHDVANHFTTAFLLDTLKGDAEAHAALVPSAVDFVGVTYQAEGY